MAFKKWVTLVVNKGLRKKNCILKDFLQEKIGL